eukprot:CAMPEP_0201123208 /NCGR_PEP_ID=MMETSP0850-20130426/6636_1 /ASSEMBLY_ACC=CAM_ASM_000622 /TAXON_ID=183588 /ORGANISM="Pseudo-nitzschia fraudulenta, Strain WWA7" /LENGTH=314 /DNA_ID=CAMNT_0047390057 /DNA_START=1 /DNA_END=945 /DNA_ORIENTATION=+
MTTTLLEEYRSLLVSTASESGGELKDAADISTIFYNSDTDALTASDTLLVIDMQHDFLPGGTFGVAEGDSCLDGISDLIAKFQGAGATVIATREYHPKDHCSFIPNGGPFPEHCVQGTRGSFFHPKIASALQLARQAGESKEGSQTTHVVYKAFTKDIDSFGGFPYTDEDEGDGTTWETRLSHAAHCTHGGCLLEWTGAYSLHSSNLVNDANAPPDVMSVLDKRPTAELLPTPLGRVFVCGLAFDFCVVDTAINFCEYAKNNSNNKSPCFIVQDLTRAANIPGVGKFGSGFLTDPKSMLEKLTKNKIRLTRFVE